MIVELREFIYEFPFDLKMKVSFHFFFEEVPNAFFNPIIQIHPF